MTEEEERECVKIANQMYKQLPRYAKVPWIKIVKEAKVLYRTGVRFRD